MFAWLRRRRRKRILSEPFPEAWGPVLQALPFFAALQAEEQGRLRTHSHIFVEEKSWEGCGGLELTDEMRVNVAAQACLLILNLHHDYYRRVESILVYPSTYRESSERDLGRAGEAMLRGPVVLSWDATFAGGRNPVDGRNVVFHEFAHKLDMLDDFVDGVPPLSERMQLEAWRTIVGREYEKLVHAAEDGRATLLDHYGAVHPAEFFAVATECFFERAPKMARKHPELYDVMRRFYLQDPAARAKGRKPAPG